MTIRNIENSQVYKQILKDSFGGVMYDMANQNKYDAAEIIKFWDEMTHNQKDRAGGIMKGAIDFVKGI